MIGYNDLNINDFINYWHGCWVYYIAANGNVSIYSVGDVEEYDDNHDISIGDCVVWLNALGGNGGKNVAIRELFDDPRWITHRFQLGYVRTEDDKLWRMTVEPNDRRMRKGTSMHECTLHAIATHSMTRADPLPSIVKEVLNEAPAPAGNDTALLRGIGDVLAFGHAPCTRRIVRETTACEATHDAVRYMLSGYSAHKVVVPDFSTAIIGHRHMTGTATVLANGAVVGQLKLTDEGTLVLTASTQKYTTRDARKLARQGIMKRALNLYADAVQWTL